MKTKILLAFLCIIIGSSLALSQTQQNSSLGTEKAANFAKSWEATPGTNNDKELAIKKPGEWIFVGTKTVDGPSKRDKIGTLCRDYWEIDIFIKYDEQKHQFETKHSSPHSQGESFDIFFLLAAIFGFIIFEIGILAIIEEWEKDHSFDPIVLPIVIIFGGMTLLNLYIFSLTILISVGISIWILISSIKKKREKGLKK